MIPSRQLRRHLGSPNWQRYLQRCLHARTEAGGWRYIEAMAAAMLTARKLLERTKLSDMDIEPKGSCWLFAMLSNIAGAIDNRVQPSCRDRLLDHYLRREAIWKPMLKRAKTRWHTLDHSESVQLLRMLLNLQLVPSQAARRPKKSAVAHTGWQPDGGWAGTYAYDYLVM